MSTASAAPTPAPPLLLALRDIKLAHSLFAMPFAILAAFLVHDAAAGWERFVGQLTIIIVCMFFARTWAMLVNRIADARLDEANPRTARRAIPSGGLARRRAVAFALGSGALFVAACALFWIFFANPWPVLLSVPALAWIGFYSFTKRFTWLCHLFLGGALAASPVAAAIAVSPDRLAQTTAVWWLAAMVLVWVAGFDVIYALQDLDFDRGAGVRSVPARFGWRGAAWISRGLHILALAALVAAGVTEPRFGGLWWGGVAGVGGLLVVEHVVLAARGRAGLPMAFFTCNGVISVLLGLAGVLDTL